MHHHCEIIMPPTEDIQTAVDSILRPFNEDPLEDMEYRLPSFWDWYVIGGRWAGTKEACGYDPNRLEEFYKRLRKEEITVSSVRAGKQSLDPASQIPKVDAMWAEYFPTEDGSIVSCPLFAHANNKYDSNSLIACDICTVEEIPENLTCARVIIASLAYSVKTRKYDGEMEAKFMASKYFWNGVNSEKTNWSGNVKDALRMYSDQLCRYKEEYKEGHIPKNSWICVTVDYHS